MMIIQTLLFITEVATLLGLSHYLVTATVTVERRKSDQAILKGKLSWSYGIAALVALTMLVVNVNWVLYTLAVRVLEISDSATIISVVAAWGIGMGYGAFKRVQQSRQAPKLSSTEIADTFRVIIHKALQYSTVLAVALTIELFI